MSRDMRDDGENFICWDRDGVVCDSIWAANAAIAATKFMDLQGERTCYVAPWDGSWVQLYRNGATKEATVCTND